MDWDVPTREDKCHYERREEKTEQRGESCVKDAEIRVIQPQAKGLLEPLKPEEERKDALLKASRRPNLANLEFWISGLQNCERLQFCCFKPLSCHLLWKPWETNPMTRCCFKCNLNHKFICLEKKFSLWQGKILVLHQTEWFPHGQSK